MSKKCQNCGFELADKMNFCPQCHAKYEVPACGAPVHEVVSDGVVGRGGETVEYSDKSYTKFIILAALPLQIGQGYFYIGRKRLGVIAALIGVLSLVLVVGFSLNALHSRVDRANERRYRFYRGMDERRKCLEVARKNLRTIDKYLENARYSDKKRDIKEIRDLTSRFINELEGYSFCSKPYQSSLLPKDLTEQLESYPGPEVYADISSAHRHMDFNFSDLLSYDGFIIPWYIFFGICLLQLIVAFFIKTDGDGKKLK